MLYSIKFITFIYTNENNQRVLNITSLQSVWVKFAKVDVKGIDTYHCWVQISTMFLTVTE